MAGLSGKVAIENHDMDRARALGLKAAELPVRCAELRLRPKAATPRSLDPRSEMTKTVTSRASAPPVPTAADLEAFETVPHGRTFEDFEVGQVLHHHWGRTFTESDAVLFATATTHWLPLYLNVEYARAHGHPGIAVPPMLVLGTVVGLSVEDLSEIGGPFLGVSDCVFRRPVYPGDTVTATSTVLGSRRSASQPGAGIVTWRTEAVDQNGESVLSFVRSNLVAMRGHRVRLKDSRKTEAIR
jgi:acyl dehydratase